MWFAMATVAQGACPEVGPEIQHAMGALTLLNLDGAKEDLTDAERGFGCGSPASRKTLAKYWLAEGVMLALDGDFDAAKLSFAASKDKDPDGDVTPFGEVVANAYEGAPAPTGVGRLKIEPELGSAWRVMVDGESFDGDLELSEGTHLVQILEDAGPAHLARFVEVIQGGSVVVEHDLPDLPPPPPREPVQSRLYVWGAAGAQLFIGNKYRTAVDGQALTEPSPKIVAPFTFGLHMDIGRGWGRISTQFAPLLNGRFIYAGEAIPEHSWFSWGIEAGGGGRIRKMHTGLLVGARIPSRITARAVLGIPVARDWFVEPSLGVALPTARPPEPVLGLELGYRFRL